MILNHNVEIALSRYATSIRRDRPPATAQQLKPCSRIIPRMSWAFVAAASMLLLSSPVLAQSPADAAHTLVASPKTARNAHADLPEAPHADSGAAKGNSSGPAPAAAATITGTVLDVNDALVPGANVVLQSASVAERREVTADDTAAFKFDSLAPGVPYEITINVKGFASWTSPTIVLEPSQFLTLDSIHLKIEGEANSVTVYASSEEVAVEQVHLEEQQRVLGFIPNFYAVYDSANAVPLSAKLKFKLAMRVSADPVTFAGVALMSGINQAADRPNYVQGAKGFGQRFGANAAGGFSDILIGGAILPSLLHQDPRYFYKGTGGTRSRLEHAMASPFICRGDNGNRQINFSSMGGDIGATALEMTYLPQSNRGAGTVFTEFGINTAERVFAGIAQEFIIPHFTPSLKRTK
jgi:hypothetical protein